MKLREHFEISTRSIKQLYSLSRKYFISLVSGSVVGAILPYVPIYFSARLIDALAEREGVGTLALYASLTVGLVALLSLLKLWLQAQRNVGSDELYTAYDWLYAEKAMDMSYASIEDRDVALLKERIRTETQTGFNLFYLTLCAERLVGYTVQIIASLSLSLSFFLSGSTSPWSKLAFTGGVVVTVIVNACLNRKDTQIRNDYWASCVEANVLAGKLSQYLNHYTSGKDIRLYGMAEPLVGFEKDCHDKLWSREAKMNLKCAGIRSVDTLMNYGLRFGVYLILIAAALEGGVTVGSIAQYVSSVMLLLTAATGVVSTAQIAILNHEYIKRYFSYFDIPNPMYKGSLTVEKREDNEYYIEFRDVSFRYPNTKAYALRHVNLKFKIGERLAVVGMNGSGKTTFIKLLCRLYDPTEGEILLNGVDIRKYDYNEYMSLFSIVFQDFQLFAFSLGQNVAACAKPDRPQVKNCLEKAGFGDRFHQMPKGLETALYQDFDPAGVEISGGEAQKIALARALYKDAAFIVLDEPTAALDPISEYEVYRKFNQISGGKTAVYISHRLASCRFCDEILVFHDGGIVQHGAHGELIGDESGKYYELWNAQAQYYTEEVIGPM